MNAASKPRLETTARERLAPAVCAALLLMPIAGMAQVTEESAANTEQPTAISVDDSVEPVPEAEVQTSPPSSESEGADLVQSEIEPAAEAPLDTIPVDPITAEAEEPSAEPESGGSRLLEEIVVTAQKREENLQDVPVSVAAFSGDQLDALGVDNPRDLGTITPGFIGNENLGFALYSIRGIGSDIFVPSADTGVATYIDGIYQPVPTGLSADFGKLERIEVLKGPQGTLYGRNTVGGAVNIITKKPSDELEGSLRAEFGSFSTRKLKGYVSGPLIADTLFASISVIRNQSDTYYKPIAESVVQDFDSDVTSGINPRVRWQVSDTFDLTLSSIHVETEGPSPLLGTLAPSPLVQAFGPAPQGNYEVSRDSVEDNWRNKNDLYYLESNWSPDPLNVKVLASHQKQRQQTLPGAFDFDQTEKPIATAAQLPQFGDIETVELQFSSKPDGWLSGPFVWTAGVYYFQSDVGIDPLALSLLGGEGGVASGIPLFLPPALGNLLAPVTGLIGPAVPGQLGLPLLGGVTLLSRGAVDTDALAGYGQITWNPLDWFGLTLGARYQVEDRGTTAASTGVLNSDGSETRVRDYPLGTVKTKRFSPKVSLEFRPFDDDTLVYTSFQKATKSGTFNVINLTDAPSEVKPQDVQAIEIGMKGSLLDGGLRYDLSAYQYEIENFQAQYVSLLSGGALNLYNAEKSTSRGFEGNLLWQMFPEINPGFALNAGIAYMKAEFDNFKNGSGFDEQTGQFFGDRALTGELTPPRDFSGNEMPSSPEFTGNLGLNQTLEVPGGIVELGLNGSYNSGFFFDAQNTDKASQPSHVLLGARFSYLFERWNLRASVVGSNLTDEVYFRSRFGSDFGVASQIAAPRSVLASLAWEF